MSGHISEVRSGMKSEAAWSVKEWSCNDFAHGHLQRPVPSHASSANMCCRQPGLDSKCASM
eukprot:6053219-Pleurochrysis_carterae.AAC.1